MVFILFYQNYITETISRVEEGTSATEEMGKVGSKGFNMRNLLEDEVLELHVVVDFSDFFSFSFIFNESGFIPSHCGHKLDIPIPPPECHLV